MLRHRVAIDIKPVYGFYRHSIPYIMLCRALCLIYTILGYNVIKIVSSAYSTDHISDLCRAVVSSSMVIKQNLIRITFDRRKLKTKASYKLNIPRKTL